MSQERQAVLFNAVPLFVLGGAYLAVTAALAPTLWRERRRVDVADLALVLMFPCVGIPLLVFGGVVLHDKTAIGGSVWPPFAAMLVALIPAVFFLVRWRERSLVAMSGPRAREAEERATMRDRELEAVSAISNALARTHDPQEAGRVLLDEVASVLSVDFTALALIDDAERYAYGLLARSNEQDLDWWPDVRIELASEPSGIASAFHTAGPVIVYDVATSALVSQRLVEAVGAKSGAFIPLIVEQRVIGVLVAAPTTAKRAFSQAEVVLMESLAADTAVALERTRSAHALDRALARERLVSEISRRVRSAHDLDSTARIAVTETGRAIGASRCFIRLGQTGGPTPIRAEWYTADLLPIGPASRNLPVANLALREGKTIAIEEVTGSPLLADPELGGLETLAALGTRAVLATPIVVFDETIGVLGLHRAEPGPWSGAEIALAEAVAREVGLAIHTAQLLDENQRRLGRQRGFYRIASLLAEPLSLDATLQAVAQAACEALDGAAAALLLPAGGGLALAAFYELPPSLAEFLESGAGDATDPLPACANARRMVAASDVVDDDRFGEGWQGVLGTSGYGALLAVPVEAPRTDEAGLAVVFFSGAREIEDDDLELARNLAAAARGALERSDLYESERRARGLAQQLARAGSTLGHELDPAAVVDEVVARAPALVEADACAVRLLEGEDLVVIAAEGEGAQATVGSRAPSTSLLAGDIVQSRSPITVANLADEQRLSRADPLFEKGYAAYLGVPIAGPEGALHGVLSVYSRRSRTWREEEVEAVLALAGNASAALASAELYQRVALEKERSVAILANIADGIVAVDREGEVVLWNAAAEKITGVPAAGALDRTQLEVLGRNLQGGEAEAAERFVPIRRGSDEVLLSLTEAVMRDPTGAVAGRIFAFRDVSAERVVEQMKSDFVSTVSHELRTPLTSIYGFAETLLRQDVLFGEEERKTFLGYIASESERLTQIVDALLNVARLDTGDLQVHLAPTDVGSVVAEVVSSVEQTHPLNGHRFSVELPSEPLQAEADRDKLRQIVTNLVDNAVKFSPNGGTVTVVARRKDESVEVRVEDEGVGIPEAEQRRIFTKFYRAEAVARERGAGGTGLGLFIAHGLVHAMGGRIWVDSREGEGSSFVFELPAVREPALAGRD
ncbi:MAG: GAF domain-containing protein [Actinomycetota bacterium]|nr:GAF domain-containing protein [Actinomycetota bacterium]